MAGRSSWRQGWLLWIWHSRLSGDVVDHGVGGRETRRDLVVAGRAQHTRRAQVIDAFASEGLGELDLHLG